MSIWKYRGEMMNGIIITNNTQVKQKHEKEYKVEFLKDTYLEVLLSVRNRIHEGHTLLTHPLSGSVKPNETPYKSIIISKDRHDLDFKSLMIIEDSINTAKKFIGIKNVDKWCDEILEDFMEIDCRLIDSGIESMLVGR